MTIFDEQVARKPDNYSWAKDYIDAMHNGFWTDKEFTFTSDKQDFRVSLTEEERGIIIRTLSAIAQIEIAVKKFWAKLGDNLPHPSLVDLGLVLASVEVIHNLAYQRLLDELDLNHVFEENLKLDVINGRVQYLQKYNKKYYKDSKKQYVYALILFTLFVENVSLFSQFYIILWFERFRNVLKDTSQQVNYTKREECYIKGTEVLTPNGWTLLENITVGDDIYQYNSDGTIELTKVLHKTENNFTGNLIKFSRQRNECVVTPDHEMIYFSKRKGFQKRKAKDIKFHKEMSVPIGGFLKNENNCVLSNEDRLKIAIQADGSNLYWENSVGEKVLRGKNGGFTHSFRITKERKQLRLKNILESLNIEYSTKVTDKVTGELEFKIKYNNDFNYKFFNWVSLKNKSIEWCKEFVQECSVWDGFKLETGIGYCSTVKKNIDMVQTIAILSGYVTNIIEGSESDRNPNYKNCYKLHMTESDHKPISHSIKSSNVSYNGPVYCVTVASGAIITRYNNKTFIAGNCLHAAVGVKLINTIREEHPELFDEELENKILHEAGEAFKSESKIIDWIVGKWSDRRISANVLKEYIKSRINDSLIDIGFKKLYEIDVNLVRDFEWMNEDCLGNNSTDFFHQRPTEYAKSVTIDEDNLI